MKRTLKWSAPLALLLATGFAAPASAQGQEFLTNVEKGKKTLTDIITLIDNIEARNKAARSAAASGAVTAPTLASSSGRTYTLIVSGAQ